MVGQAKDRVYTKLDDILKTARQRLWRQLNHCKDEQLCYTTLKQSSWRQPVGICNFLLSLNKWEKAVKLIMWQFWPFLSSPSVFPFFCHRTSCYVFASPFQHLNWAAFPPLIQPRLFSIPVVFQFDVPHLFLSSALKWLTHWFRRNKVTNRSSRTFFF